MYIYTYIDLNHFAGHLKLTQHCKSTILQYTIKNQIWKKHNNYLLKKRDRFSLRLLLEHPCARADGAALPRQGPRHLPSCCSARIWGPNTKFTFLPAKRVGRSQLLVPWPHRASGSLGSVARFAMCPVQLQRLCDHQNQRRMDPGG